MPPHSPRRWVGRRLWRCWPRRALLSGVLNLVRSISRQVEVWVIGGRVLGGGVASSLLLIFPNYVFSGWSGGGRLIVHAKTIVPVGVMDEPALVSLVERSKHSFNISSILVCCRSGGSSKEVFGEVASLAPLLSLRRLGCLLPTLPLCLFLRDLLLASVLNSQLRRAP